MKELTCVVCPLGCSLKVKIENNQVQGIEGNGCKRGIAYAEAECINPTRVLTTTVKVHSGQTPMVSVKSEKPLPKGLLFECMKVINTVVVTAPVSLGDVMVENILGTGINIVATKNVY